jgi:diguanylate cyclase (GGDEF)-like protein
LIFPAIKKHITNVQPLRTPLSVSTALKAFLDTQLEVLPIVVNHGYNSNLYGSDLKSLHFKDAIPLIMGCRNGKACHEYIPDVVLKDIFYLDINSSDDVALESLKKGLENETSMAVLRGDVYIGMVTLKNIVSFITEQKIKDAITTSPLTGLPGNYSIKKEFERQTLCTEPFYICYSDLSNFKSYNDKYGIAKGDEVLKFTAFLLSNLCKGNFVGHVGGDDFVFFLPIVEAEKIVNNIIAEFDKGIVDFYSESHRKQGYIIATDRDGKVRTFPIMSIVVAALLVDKSCSFDCASNSFVDLKERLKKECQINGGSRYAFDKRKLSTIE